MERRNFEPGTHRLCSTSAVTKVQSGWVCRAWSDHAKGQRNRHRRRTPVSRSCRIARDLSDGTWCRCQGFCAASRGRALACHRLCFRLPRCGCGFQQDQVPRSWWMGRPQSLEVRLQLYVDTKLALPLSLISDAGCLIDYAPLAYRQSQTMLQRLKHVETLPNRAIAMPSHPRRGNGPH